MKVFILIITLWSATSVFSERVPYSIKLIRKGHRLLEDTSNSQHLKQAKKTFKKVQFICFYRRHIVKDAKIGLSLYHLEIGDTLKSIKILRKTIGKTLSKKIESNNFSNISVSRKSLCSKRHASRKLIQVHLKLGNYNLAKNYLKFYKEYAKVKWHCGSGAMGEWMFIEEIENTLKKNGF
jgi:hypothetical protein